MSQFRVLLAALQSTAERLQLRYCRSAAPKLPANDNYWDEGPRYA